MWKLEEKDSLDIVAKGLSGYQEKRALWRMEQKKFSGDLYEKNPMNIGPNRFLIEIGTKRTLQKLGRKELSGDRDDENTVEPL